MRGGRDLVYAALLVLLLHASPAGAETLALDRCLAQTTREVSRADLDRLAFDCTPRPLGTDGWLWTRATLPPSDGARVLLVRQTRFRELRMVVVAGSSVVRDQRLRSGIADARWIIGGFAAFDIPATRGDTRLLLGFEGVPTHTILRVRIYDAVAFARLTVAWTVAIGLFLGIIAASFLFNGFLLAVLRTRATTFQLLWTGAVLAWGACWSQVSLLLFPTLAGTANARAASVLAALASATPTGILLASTARGELPRWLRRMAAVPASAMPPLALIIIYAQGPVTPLRLLYDLSVVLNGIGIVAACMVAWRRGSIAARTIVWTFGLPIAAAVLFAWGSLRGGTTWGISELTVLAMAAAQTVLLTTSMTFHFLAVRRERDRAQISETHATALANAAIEASRAKSEFLLRLSHEIRAPLGAISGHAQLLARGAATDARRAGAIVHRATEHVVALVADLLDLALLETGQVAIARRPFDLAVALRQVGDLLEEEARIRGMDLALTLPAQLPAAVLGDEKRLSQILINLVGNALRYAEAGEVRVSLAYSNGEARIRVEDDGPGMGQEELARVFAPFERGARATHDRAGLGLGLAITRSLVAAMGGTIEVDSAPGAGTRFALLLPLAAVLPRVEPCIESLPESGAFASHLVLVVDDDPIHRRLLVDLIAPLGCLVEEFGDGAAAIARTGPCPDLAILDVAMPGADGWTVARTLRARWGEDVAILICSADPGLQGELRRDDAVHDDAIAKPYAIDEMLERVVTLMDLAPRDKAQVQASTVPGSARA